MAGKGAPEKNQYAKKEKKGRTIGLYITPEELTILENSLSSQGKSTEQLEIDRYARSVFKDAVKKIQQEE